MPCGKRVCQRCLLSLVSLSIICAVAGTPPSTMFRVPRVSQSCAVLTGSSHPSGRSHVSFFSSQKSDFHLKHELCIDRSRPVCVQDRTTSTSLVFDAGVRLALVHLQCPQRIWCCARMCECQQLLGDSCGADVCKDFPDPWKTKATLLCRSCGCRTHRACLRQGVQGDQCVRSLGWICGCSTRTCRNDIGAFSCTYLPNKSVEEDDKTHCGVVVRDMALQMDFADRNETDNIL